MGNSKTLSQMLFAFSRPLEQAPIPCLSKYFLAGLLMNKFSLCLCPIATRIQLETEYKLYCQLFYNRDQTALLLSFSQIYENKTQKNPCRHSLFFFWMHLNETHKKQSRITDAKQDRRQAGYKKVCQGTRSFTILHFQSSTFYSGFCFLNIIQDTKFQS